MADTQNDVVIHIGPPKTGSTFLQRKLFPFQNDYVYLGEASLWGGGDKLIWSLTKQAPIYDRDAVFPMLQGLASARNILISNEILAGHPWPLGKYANAASRAEIAARLRDVFPNAKIVIIERDFEDWVVSAYSEYLRNGGLLKLHQFKDYIHRAGYADWAALIKLYRSNFRDVCVLQFDVLKKNPEQFVNELASELRTKFKPVSTTPVRPRIKGIESSSLVRNLNFFRRSGLNPTAPFFHVPLVGRLINRL